MAQDIALATSPPKARKSLDHLNTSSTRLSTRSSQDDLQHGSTVRPPKPVSSSPVTDQGPSEHTPLLHDESYSGTHIHGSLSSEGNALAHDQTEHNHGHGHNQPQSGSMNMRALLLHVLGDALGNVGVISTGLVIWFSTWSFKYYFDPVISLVITVIIFSSALPLGMPCLSHNQCSLTKNCQFAALLLFSSKEFLPPSRLKRSELQFSKLKVFSPFTNCMFGNSPNRRS